MSDQICRRCKEPVVSPPQEYLLFEGMHWPCFHMEFEHIAPEDENCADPSCPIKALSPEEEREQKVQSIFRTPNVSFYSIEWRVPAKGEPHYHGYLLDKWKHVIYHSSNPELKTESQVFEDLYQNAKRLTEFYNNQTKNHG